MDSFSSPHSLKPFEAQGRFSGQTVQGDLGPAYLQPGSRRGIAPLYPAAGVVYIQFPQPQTDAPASRLVGVTEDEDVGQEAGVEVGEGGLHLPGVLVHLGETSYAGVAGRGDTGKPGGRPEDAVPAEARPLRSGTRPKR